MPLELAARPSKDALSIEAAVVAPDLLRGKSAGEIERLPILIGSTDGVLAEVCTVRGEIGGDDDVRLTGDWSRVKRLGARMASGRLIVESSVGMHAGAGMTGGELIVHGGVDDWAGAEMTGGRLVVQGDAGGGLGGVYPGGTIGMRGGEILVDGSAGDEVGAALSRGLIAVGGRCGAYAGLGMLSGTLLLFGSVGATCGLGMKRGSIALLAADSDEPQPSYLPPTFAYSCRYGAEFVQMYLRTIAGRGFAPAKEAVANLGGGKFRRYCGDLVEFGKGELLVRDR
ncbi:MAG: formylmethanofuran dehydrogenase subunit C [Planctomycetia bacterium]